MSRDEKIREVRERTDIVSLIGEYVTLKRVGSSFKGLCPFHSEKSASFHVHPARQFFHCFGCQASGDVFQFVMRIEGRSFPEALRQLADRAGVELPSFDAREDAGARREKERRERLLGIVDSAAGFFVRMLDEHPTAGLAREALEARAMRPETVSTYRLGYAPSGWDGLAKHLVSRGFSLEEAEQAGLVVPRRSGDGHYDRFRHRLMFPISDLHGKIVAFSGRALPPPPGEEPPGDPPAKYVNSPEGPLYKKSDLLFGLFEARIALRQAGVAILCEGNFDVLAMHQAGLQHVVAPLGTAFTASQARLLKRFVSRVVVLFDADGAGAKATAAAAPLLREAGLLGSVVVLPRGEDPDSFLRGQGAAALEGLLASAPPLLEHLIELAASSAGPDPAEKAAAIEGLGPLLAGVESPIEASLYVERVGQAFQIADLGAVRRQLRAGVRNARGRRRPVAPPSADAVEAAAPSASEEEVVAVVGVSDISQIPGVERDLVACALDQPGAFEGQDLEKISELLTSREMEAILRAALRQANVHGTVVASSLLDSVEGEGVVGKPARSWLEERLALETFDATSARTFLDTAMPLLRKQQIEREQRELMRRIQQALREGDQERARELIQLRDALFRAGGALQRRR